VTTGEKLDQILLLLENKKTSGAIKLIKVQMILKLHFSFFRNMLGLRDSILFFWVSVRN